MSRASVINANFTVTENLWVVSALNTTRSLIEGHAAIVVEGVSDSQPFIGQYDIATGADEKQDNSIESGSAKIQTINIKGFITKIKCFENADNKRNYQEEKYPAQSYYVSSQAAKNMIASIKQDADVVKKGVENWTRRNNGQALHLDEKGSPIEPLKYQKLGKHHFLVKIFGDTEAGDNCAGWCLAKLAVGGVGDGTDIPKPKFLAGQINCSSFFKDPYVQKAMGVAAVGLAAGIAYKLGCFS